MSKISYCKDMSAFKNLFGYWFLVIGLLLTVNLFIFSTPVFAQTSDFEPLTSNNFTAPINTQYFADNVVRVGVVTLYGQDFEGGPVLATKYIYKEENGEIKKIAKLGLTKGDYSQGVLASAISGIATLYDNQPVSSLTYLAYLGDNIGFSPKSAYAQVGGSGSIVIDPVLKLWQVTRNIAYLCFILVFVAAGIMIMFRQKLNPQTVIGIQQALPGLIVGLILVTFSYFIAAFIVDLAFVGTRVITEIFISSGAPNYYGCGVDCKDPKKDPTGYQQQNSADLMENYNKSDVFDLYQKAGTRLQNFSDVGGQVWQMFSPKTDTGGAFGRAGEKISSGSLGGIMEGIGSIFAYAGQTIAAGSATATATWIIPLLLGIALFIQFIRLLIALIMTYLQILVMVILGPFLILFSAIPGKGDALTMWWKSLFANTLVFPAVFAGFLFAGMLLQWDSSQLNQQRMPLFGGVSAAILKSLLAFGVLLGLPSIPDQVREALGVKGPKGFTQAAIGGFMGGVGGAQAGYNQAMQRTSWQGTKEAMEKAKIESNAGARMTQKGSPQNLGERVLSWLPSARH